MSEIKENVKTILAEFQMEANLTATKLFVIGCSTSEVIGKHIGTSGTEEVAADLFAGFTEFQKSTGVELAFQCCEHLNRALVMERTTADKGRYDIVAAIPVRQAGGAMATYAYNHMTDPVLVEFVQADAGIDIGNTLIGMHLKHVAVPVRPKVKQIGQAYVTLAKTRPKLIGGVRAVYS